MVSNWAGNIEFGAARVHRPGSVAEVQEIVANAERVRVLGSGHSFNRIADTDGDLLILSGLPEAVEIAGATARVGPGVRFGELYMSLDAAGLALPNTGSLPHISVAGAAATGTHGSGETNRNLAAGIIAVDVVTATGDLVTLTRDDPSFPGAVLALGALGVVTSLTVGSVPSYEVRQDVYVDMARATFDDHLDEILGTAYSVSAFMDWRGPVVQQVWLKQRTSDDVVSGPDFFGAPRATEHVHPVPGMPPEHTTQQLGVPGRWYERMPHFRMEFTPSSGDELQSEYLVPREHGLAALHALDGIAEDLARVLQISEIRTVAADDMWLSPCYRTDVIAFHFTWHPDWAAVSPVLTAIEDRLAPYDARPHWGKLFHTLPHRLYPRLDDFRALRDRLDPQYKFTNALVASWLD
jgi:alditol oxidase